MIRSGADLGGGGGGEGAAAPPFVWVWDFLGRCPRMVHEPLRTYGFQTTKRSQKHFICITSTCISRDFRDPDFKISPGEPWLPRTSLAYECLHVCYKPPLQNAHCSPCVNQEMKIFKRTRSNGAELTFTEWWISLRKLDICDLLTPLVTPANHLKMQEMEGLDFKNFRGSMPPGPPSLRMPVVISPPLQTSAPRSLCEPQGAHTTVVDRFVWIKLVQT